MLIAVYLFGCVVVGVHLLALRSIPERVCHVAGYGKKVTGESWDGQKQGLSVAENPIDMAAAQGVPGLMVALALRKALSDPPVRAGGSFLLPEIVGGL